MPGTYLLGIYWGTFDTLHQCLTPGQSNDLIMKLPHDICMYVYIYICVCVFMHKINALLLV